MVRAAVLVCYVEIYRAVELDSEAGGHICALGGYGRGGYYVLVFESRAVVYVAQTHGEGRMQICFDTCAHGVRTLAYILELSVSVDSDRIAAYVGALIPVALIVGRDDDASCYGVCRTEHQPCGRVEVPRVGAAVLPRAHVYVVVEVSVGIEAVVVGVVARAVSARIHLGGVTERQRVPRRRMERHAYSQVVQRAPRRAQLEVDTRARHLDPLRVVHVVELIGHLRSRGIYVAGIDVILAVVYLALVLHALDAYRCAEVELVVDVEAERQPVLADRAAGGYRRELVDLARLSYAVDEPAVLVAVRQTVLVGQHRAPVVGIVGEIHRAVGVGRKIVYVRQRAEDVGHGRGKRIAYRHERRTVVEVGYAVVDQTYIEVDQRSRALVCRKYAAYARHAEARLAPLLEFGRIGLRVRELQHRAQAYVALDIHAYTGRIERCRYHVGTQRREGVAHAHRACRAVVVRSETHLVDVRPLYYVAVENRSAEIELSG